MAKEEKIPRKTINWEAAKIEFITESLKRATRSETLTLKEFAEQLGISYGQLRNMAGKGNWKEELKQRMRFREEKAVRRATEYEAINEAEIRTRQAKFARLASNKAITKLNLIDPATLTVREAIELLRLGLIEERRALGLPDAFTFAPPTKDEHGDYQSVITHINRQRELSDLSKKLLEFVDKKVKKSAPIIIQH
jgi:hypothetical protein